MASRNFKIKVVVEDAATNRMKRVGNQLKRTGRSIDDASKRFMAFNRTLFTTTAFVGIFLKAFQGMSRSLATGANFELVEKQFERTLGPKGNLIRQIKGMTDIAVDRMEAMRAGIQLANLGVISTTSEAANIISKAGVAAKLSAMDTGEGIQRVTRFLKTANIQELEALNIIRTGDPELRARLGVIGATAKTMSGAVRAQYLYTEGLRLLDRATKGFMFGQRSLSDTLKDFKETFANLGGQFGKFIGKALGPMIDKFTELGDRLANVIEKLTLNKRFIEISKAAIVTTVAVTGLVGALGALRLLTIALGSVGFGIPKLIFMLMSGVVAFKTLTDGADDLVERLRIFKNFIVGVWQLIGSFDKKTGISKLDKDVQEMLRKNGLLVLAKNIARVATVIRYFVTDVGSTLIDWGKTAFNWITKLVQPFKELLDMDGGPWARSWIEGMDGMRGMLIKLTAGFLVFKGLKGLLGGLLSKIPVIGRIFGGGSLGRGPKGTVTDPIYTASVSGAMSGAGALIGKIPGVGRLSRALQNFVLKIPFLANILTHPKGLFRGLVSSIGGALRAGAGFFVKALSAAWPILLKSLPVALAGAVGYAVGTKIEPYITRLIDKHTKGKTEEGFEGNALERGFFKLDKFFGGETSKKFMENQNKYEQNMANIDARTPRPARKSQVSTPYNVKDEMLKIDEIGTSISAIKDAEHKKIAQSQVEAFLQSDSEGERQITEAERKIITEAVESKDYLREIAENTKSSKPADSQSRR